MHQGDDTTPITVTAARACCYGSVVRRPGETFALGLDEAHRALCRGDIRPQDLPLPRVPAPEAAHVPDQGDTTEA